MHSHEKHVCCDDKHLKNLKSHKESELVFATYDLFIYLVRFDQ